MNNNKQKTSIISIIGAPNAGKSTLMNNLIGAKVSIVTPKVQTTRTTINGIYTEGDAQLVFLDTPGIFAARHKMEQVMVRAAWSSVAGSDKILFMIDAAKEIAEFNLEILNNLMAKKIKVYCILNKIDKAVKETIAKLKEQLNQYPIFLDFFEISALHRTNMRDLLVFLMKTSPLSPWLYEGDELTNAPARFLASEITREIAFKALDEELPYNLAVETEKWEDLANGDVKLYQAVYVTRDSHKKIFLGYQGAMIKKIGAGARREMKNFFEKNFHLFLHVKVRDNWRDNESLYHLK